MTEDEKRTFSRKHINPDTCHLDDVMSPNASRIDNDTTVNFAFFAGMIIAEANAFHTTIA